MELQLSSNFNSFQMLLKCKSVSLSKLVKPKKKKKKTEWRNSSSSFPQSKSKYTDLATHKAVEASKNTQCLLSLPQIYQTRRLIFTHDLKETLFPEVRGEEGGTRRNQRKAALD
jgi:hypothetical protein